MEQSELMVRRIKEGTVIDHIDEGKGIQVLDALRIDGKDGSLITIALNVPSGKSKKKDIIKVENKFLKDDDTNKIVHLVVILKGYCNLRFFRAPYLAILFQMFFYKDVFDNQESLSILFHPISIPIF